jgi:hypothetical protein
VIAICSVALVSIGAGCGAAAMYGDSSSVSGTRAAPQVGGGPSLAVKAHLTNDGHLILRWSLAPGATGYALYRDGRRVFQTSDPRMTTVTLGFVPGSGHLFTVRALGVSRWGQKVVGLTTPGCFAQPGACGYPDPETGNVGVPPNTTLTPSGSVTTSKDGQVISGLDITGSITVQNKNVTIQDCQVTSSGSDGAGIIIQNGATGTRIVDSTVRGAGPDPSESMESAVFNHFGMADTVALRDYFYNESDPWEGPGTITNSYLISNGVIDNAHYEDVYVSDDTVIANHDTLFNPQQQTATIFGDTQLGSGGSASNHITVTNSLVAGGGFVFYMQSGSTDVGTSTMTVAGNRFARCRTPAVYDSDSGGSDCSGGADASGYHPHGGYFGLLAHTYCPPLDGQVWSGNVWDDNSAPLRCS